MLKRVVSFFSNLLGVYGSNTIQPEQPTLAPPHYRKIGRMYCNIGFRLENQLL